MEDFGLIKKSSRGFTLLEVVIYLALFGIIIGGAVATTYQIVANHENLQSRVFLQEEGNFLLGKLNWAFDDAKAITLPAVSGPKLTIKKNDDSTFDYIYDGATKTLSSDSTGPVLPLNSGYVTISALTFTHLTAPEEGLKADFTLQVTDNNGIQHQQDFSFTKYLRQ